ncbi:hypothetical protein CXB51_009766 [Gossypium anomalum]|uniref:Retrovirus-related Pol polyprotein from transposon TNT 1-94 n=1 Tax=Gossypium anomalum TaxID=47600 RepID=A0A8J6D620_9ROSI|nr:hypothetical protein CXB51_009766 [Gossypium anomalum]
MSPWEDQGDGTGSGGGSAMAASGRELFRLFVSIMVMATLKYDILLLDRNTWFTLWQIKIQTFLAQMDLEDSLLGVDKMPSTLTEEEKKCKDLKALTQLHLHLSNEILQGVMKEKVGSALREKLQQVYISKTRTSKLHIKKRLYAHHLEEVAFANNFKVSKEWILDSGCTFHMSPNRDWFTTYETVSEGVVLMRNNASCKIAGHKYTAESGVLKISKASFIVMKGQRKIAKLYVLQGFTITGDAIVTSSSLSDDNVTRLWHMRLGHMSENSIVELTKRRLLDGQGISKLKFCEHYIFRKQKRSLSIAIEKKTPQKVWSGNPTDHSDLRIFGCPLYAHVDNGKLEPRSIKCGEFEEHIYMQQPEGFTVSEKDDYVCLLKKSIYGLKQSSRQWYKRFNSFMTTHDFKRSSFDSCVYFKKNSDGSFVYLLFYVDDMLIATKDKLEIRKFRRTRDDAIEYVDFDFPGDLDKRRSHIGYVFTIGGCTISWKATLQTTVALFTTEAEYMAITEACKKAIWLKRLFGELSKDLQINTMFCNSQSVIFLAKD